MAPSAKAGRTAAAAAGIFNTAVVIQTNALAYRRVVLSLHMTELGCGDMSLGLRENLGKIFAT